MNTKQVNLDKKLYNAITKANYGCIELLLKAGADPTAFYDPHAYRESLPEGDKTLVFLQSLNFPKEIEMSIAKLLLQYGAYNMTSDEYAGAGHSPLIPAVYHENIELIELLLTYGVNIHEFDSDKMISISEIIEENNLFGGKVPDILQEDVLTTKKILNQDYIVYERDDDDEISLLGDLKTSTDLKYLYHGIDLALVFYWLVANNLVNKTIHKTVRPFLAKNTLSSKNNILELMKGSIGSRLEIDIIESLEEDEIESFIIDYLAPTHWKYNLYDDLMLLYPSEKLFPHIPNTLEEHQKVLDLITIRHEQYRFGLFIHLNSNQNKAELQALIEGKEPPKREVDLSWLEEHCGEDDLSDVDTKVTDNKTKEAHNKGDDIIPDDFFVKE